MDTEPPLRRRAIGIETEFGISSHSTKISGHTHSPTYLTEKLIHCIAGKELYPDIFWINGGRLYSDLSHPESSTPECSNVIEAIIYEKAGEKLLQNGCPLLEEKLNENKKKWQEKVRLYNHSSDWNGDNWGCHQNFQISVNNPDFPESNQYAPKFEDFAELLIPFLVTKIIYTGAGNVKTSNEGYYEISEKAPYILQPISEFTTTSRGIINTRNEPFADKRKYWRLHLINEEANMSEYTTLLKVGTTSIVLSMIEMRVCPKIQFTSNPVEILHEISKDLDFKNKYNVIVNGYGMRLSAIEIQRIYLDTANHYFPHIGEQLGDHSLKDVITNWGFVLDTLEKNPMELYRHIDWITKKYIIEKYILKRNGKWDGDAPRISLDYHKIYPPNGRYYSLLNDDADYKLERVCTDAEISHAMRNPPKNTRAYIRGKYVEKAGGVIIWGKKMDWDYINIGDTYLYSSDPRERDFDAPSIIMNRPNIELSNRTYQSYD